MHSNQQVIPFSVWWPREQEETKRVQVPQDGRDFYSLFSEKQA